MLIEDEAGVADFIVKGLTEEQFKVTVAFDAATATQLVSATTFDLYIIDIMLPDGNGLDICKKIRTLNIKSPVLFLTALGTSENIAHGLNIGGDDYLVKPFKFIELSARINALLRRVSHFGNEKKEPTSVYSIADLVIDDDSKTVIRAGRTITLTATEYRLLLVLIKNKGKLLNRMELLEGAWDIHFNMGTNVVDVYINYLRKKIDSDFEQKLIHTAVGMGYILKEK